MSATRASSVACAWVPTGRWTTVRPASAPGAILPDTDGDTDVVLLSSHSDGSQLALKVLLALLRDHPPLALYDVWLVLANVSVIKVQHNQESVDSGQMDKHKGRNRK